MSTGRTRVLSATRWVMLPTLLATTVAQVGAQNRPGPGDTLRFVQVSNLTANMESPMSSHSLRSELEMYTHVAFLAGDSAELWMDSVKVGTQPTGDLDMAAMFKELRGRLLTFRILPDGRIQETAEALGLSVLPAGSPIPQGRFWLPQNVRPGTTWTDTTSIKAGAESSSMARTTIVRYEVAGDSTYEGAPVVIVTTTITSSTTTTTSTTATGTVAQNITSQGTGRSYFSRVLGVPVYTSTKMQMESDLPAGDVTMKMRQTTESIIRLTRR